MNCFAVYRPVDVSDIAVIAATGTKFFEPLLNCINIHRLFVRANSQVLPTGRELHVVDTFLAVFDVNQLRQVSGTIRGNNIDGNNNGEMNTSNFRFLSILLIFKFVFGKETICLCLMEIPLFVYLK